MSNGQGFNRSGSYGSLMELYLTEAQIQGLTTRSNSPSVDNSILSDDGVSPEKIPLYSKKRQCSSPEIANEHDDTEMENRTPARIIPPRDHRIHYEVLNDTPMYNRYGKPSRSIRFQVVVWNVGPVDVVLGRVEMKFRVTIFWNAPSGREHDAMARTGYGVYDVHNKKIWTMHGRQRAYQKDMDEALSGGMIYVPPVSIINAASFHLIGEPEVCLVDEKKKLMKWSCMYTACLIQDNFSVSNFPHDKHDLVIKLGILRHRQPGRRWDKDIWTLDLATESDNQLSTRVPYGLVVDHVKIPEFSFDDGLSFNFEPLMFGQQTSSSSSSSSSAQYLDKQDRDRCLVVKIGVVRDSGYYDQNIIPLLALLNIVGISALGLDASEFGNRSQIIIATAFVEIGIRLTVDSKLPVVGYQIKLQWILNNFFYNLLLLNIESSFVYASHRSGRYKTLSHWLEHGTIYLSLLHTAFICLEYYWCMFSKAFPHFRRPCQRRKKEKHVDILHR